MKKILVLILIAYGQFFFSQTTTKKYNSLKEQYEYYNSDGYLIGYEKYNRIKKQWEYFTSKQEPYKSSYNNLKYEEIDLSGMAQTLALLQKKYNINRNYVQENIDKLVGGVLNSELSAKLKVSIIEKFLDGPLKKVNNLSIDYGASDSTNKVVEYLYNSMNSIIKSETKSYKTNIDTKTDTRTYVDNSELDFKNNFQNYLGIKIRIYSIGIFDKDNKYFRDEKIKTDSYITLNSDGIIYKNADGEVEERKCKKITFINDKNYFYCPTTLGDEVRIDKDLRYVRITGVSRWSREYNTFPK